MPALILSLSLHGLSSITQSVRSYAILNDTFNIDARANTHTRCKSEPENKTRDVARARVYTDITSESYRIHNVTLFTPRMCPQSNVSVTLARNLCRIQSILNAESEHTVCYYDIQPARLLTINAPSNKCDVRLYECECVRPWVCACVNTFVYTYDDDDDERYCACVNSFMMLLLLVKSTAD